MRPRQRRDDVQVGRRRSHSCDGVDEMTDPTTPPGITQRPWRDRSNALAYLPGKSAHQVDALRRVITQMPVATDGTVKLVSAAGVETDYPADAIFAKQLSGTG